MSTKPCAKPADTHTCRLLSVDSSNGAFANVALHKDVARIALQPGLGLQIDRVSALVETDHGLIGACDPVEHKVCANEASAACNENSHQIP